MKAKGMEYDERMAELEKVEYPKPNRDFIYATFNEFAAKHPWVGQENIRPKSIAREMFERFMTFADYVREYELQRSEGLVLRYLSETYKTLVQTVPEAYRDDALLDVIAFLRATVRGVDSSLIDDGSACAIRPTRPAPWTRARPSRRRSARRRSGPIRARSRRASGTSCTRSSSRSRGRTRPPRSRSSRRRGLDPARLEEAMAPYWAEHERIDTTPRSRRPDNTFVKELAPRHWEAVQRVVDEKGEVDWMLQCEIDLTSPRDPDLPLLSLVRVGT